MRLTDVEIKREKQNEFPLPPPDLTPIPDDEAVVGVGFEITSPVFGKLAGTYVPGKDGLTTLINRFRELGVGSKELVHAYKHATGLLYEKTNQNIADAMEGMFDEIVFETIRDLHGHAIFGELDSKGWMTEIKKWHATASGKRLGAHQGPQKDTVAFVRKVCDAAAKVKGPMTLESLSAKMESKAKVKGPTTQENLSEKKGNGSNSVRRNRDRYSRSGKRSDYEGIIVRTLQDQIDAHGFTWPAIKMMAELYRKRRP